MESRAERGEVPLEPTWEVMSALASLGHAWTGRAGGLLRRWPPQGSYLGRGVPPKVLRLINLISLDDPSQVCEQQQKCICGQKVLLILKDTRRHYLKMHRCGASTTGDAPRRWRNTIHANSTQFERSDSTPTVSSALRYLQD
jgi:hypothetical protein